MKKLILGLLVFTTIACKKEAVKEGNTVENEVVEKVVSENALEGEFLFYADAAIFKTKSEVYGVILNAEAQTLIEKAKPFKKEATDMVWVKIKGEFVPKDSKEEGWPFNVKVTDVIEVKGLSESDNVIINKK